MPTGVITSPPGGSVRLLPNRWVLYHKICEKSIEIEINVVEMTRLRQETENRKIEFCYFLLSFCVEILPFIRAKLEQKAQVHKS